MRTRDLVGSAGVWVKRRGLGGVGRRKAGLRSRPMLTETVNIGKEKAFPCGNACERKRGCGNAWHVAAGRRAGAAGGTEKRELRRI